MKPKYNPSRVSTALITICVGMSVAGTSNVAGLTWDGGAGTSNFETPANWVTDVSPFGDPASIATTDRMNISNGATVSRAANITVNRVTVSGGSTLNVTAGTHNDNAGGTTGSRNIVGNGSTGVVNLSGATTSYNIGQQLAIANANSSNGKFIQTGGALNVSRIGTSSQIGGWGGTTFAGHTTTSFGAAHSLQIGGNNTATGITGLYEISGGSLVTRAGVGIGMNGTFSIVGSTPTVITLGGSNTDYPGWWAQSSSGTLKARVDDGGIRKILIETSTNAQVPFVEFQSGAKLDVGFAGTPVSGTWTLMELQNGDITNGGLAFAPGVDTSVWSFNIDNSGANGLLTVTAVVVRPNLFWTGTPSGDWNIGTTANWLDDITPATYSEPSDVNFEDIVTGANTVNLTTTLSPATVTVNNTTTSYTFSGTGKLSGAAKLTKKGAGSLTISNSGGNDFTGPVELNGGTVTLGNANALGAASGALTVAGSALDLGTFGVTKSAVTLTSGSISNGTLTDTPVTAEAGTLSASLTGASTTLMKTGVGALTLNSANTYGGLTTLGGGTLALGVASALGDTTSGLTVNGGILDLGTFSVTKGAVTIKGGTLNNGMLTGTSFATEAGTVNVPLAGAGATLTKTNTGALTLNAANTYDGATTLSAGTLNINTTTALGATASTINLNGGTIDNTSGSAITLANNQAIVLGGNFAYSTAAGTAANNLQLGNGGVSIAANRTITLNGTGALTFGGVLTNTVDGFVTLTVNNGTGTSSASAVNFGGYALTGPAGTFALTGAIGGSGNVNITGPVTDGPIAGNGLTYSGSGVLTLSGSNTYTGNTTVTGAGGVLRTPTATALVGYGTENVVFDGGAIGVQVGAGGWTTAELDNLLATASKYGGALGIDTTLGDLIQWKPFTAADFGALGLTKLGVNALTLTGNNTYSGPTVLKEGTLNVNSTTALGDVLSTINLNGGTIDNTSGAAITLANNQEIVLGGNFAYSTATGTAANNLNLGTGAVSIAADRTITLNGIGELTFGGVLTNTGNSVRTLTVNNGAGTSPASAVNFAGYALTGTSSTAARVNVINGSGNMNITGAVTDGVSTPSGLTYSGTGLLTLSAANTYTGQTNISSGTVKLGHTAALGGQVAPSIALDTTITNGSTTAMVAPFSPIAVGASVLGAGMPFGAVVTAYAPITGTVTLNAAATSDGTTSATFANTVMSTTNGSATVTVTANSPIVVGMSVTGTGIPSGTRVTAYTSPTVTLSQNATATGTVLGVFAGTTSVDVNGTLDLNGQTVAENWVGNEGTFINSNTTTPAEITTEMVTLNNPEFDGPGDIKVDNIRMANTNTRRITKNGTGTLTLGGTVNNNRHGLTVNNGTVLLNKPAGTEAVGRYALIMNGGTVRLLASNQIQNNTDVAATIAASNGIHQINAGTLDLNGFSEGLGGLGTSTGTEPGGIISNSTETLSTLTLLGLTNADPLLTTATFPGAISGNIALVKQGANKQVLTGTLGYTGDTTITSGTLELGAASALDDNSAVRINGATSILKLADGANDVVKELWIDGGQLEAGTYGATGSGAENIDNVHFAGTGVLEVTTGDPVATDYENWAAIYAPADLTDTVGDNDNDGLDNQTEYAFGLNPVSGSSVSPILTHVDKTTGTFTYQRRAGTGLTYQIQTSTDLVLWPVDATAGQVAGAVDGNSNQTVTVTLTGTKPLTAPKLFVRVAAE